LIILLANANVHHTPLDWFAEGLNLGGDSGYRDFSTEWYQRVAPLII